tara:strand:+ start:300 stop:1076 length:777 start_codon:yes stop_codon:yes gene_type:complete
MKRLKSRFTRRKKTETEDGMDSLNLTTDDIRQSENDLAQGKSKRGSGLFGMIIGNYMLKIKNEIHMKINNGLTNPKLETAREKQIAIENFDRSWGVLEYYIKKIFWKKLKKSGIMRRMKVKGLSGFILSIVSLIPGAGPLIVAPIKAFVVFYTTYMDFSSKYSNEIVIGKKIGNTLKGNEDMKSTLLLAERYVSHLIEEEKKLNTMFGKRGGKKSRKHSRNHTRNHSRKHGRNHSRNHGRNHSRKHSKKARNNNRKQE